MMFKSVISALSSSVYKTAANSLGQYKPSTDNLVDGAYSRHIQQGIANIAHRSPILSDIASTAFNVFQTELVKKKKIKEYVKSSDSNWLRPKVKEKLGDVSQDKIDSEMMKIISKISSQIDKIGVEETKKNEEFKEYSQYFDKFKQETVKPGDVSPQTGLGDEILSRIEANTKQTVNALETLSINQNSNSSTSNQTINGASFIDPTTGMPSIKAGVGAIGGMMIGKIFDDKMIDKLVGKARKMFDLDDEPENEATKKPKARKKSSKFGDGVSVEKMFHKDLFDIKKEILKKPVVDNKELNKTLKELKPDKHTIKPLISKISDSRKIESAINLLAPKIFKAVPLGKTIANISTSVANKTDIAKLASKLLKHTPLPQKIHMLGGAAKATEPSGGSAAGSVAGGLLGRFALSTLSAAAGAVSLPVLGVTAAVGAASYGGYKFIKGREKQKQLIEEASKKIEDNQRKISSDKQSKTENINKLDDKTDIRKISSDKQSKTENINKLDDKKISLTKEAKTTEKNQQPIVLNNSSNSAPTATNHVSISPSVRNKESTFERVQMQDFWSRAA